MAKSGVLPLADIRATFRLIGECTELGADPYVWRAPARHEFFGQPSARRRMSYV